MKKFAVPQLQELVTFASKVGRPIIYRDSDGSSVELRVYKNRPRPKKRGQAKQKVEKAK